MKTNKLNKTDKPNMRSHWISLIKCALMAIFFAWLGNIMYDNVFGKISWVLAFCYAFTSIIEALIISFFDKFKIVISEE